MRTLCPPGLLLAILFVPLALGVPQAGATPASQKHSSFEYNPQAVVTVTGMITAIDPTSASNLPEPVFITLDTPQGKIKVFLGPNWYVAEQSMKLAVLDRLEVTGAKIVDQGRVVIFAAEVKKGEQTWQIRDDQGVPLWIGHKKAAP